MCLLAPIATVPHGHQRVPLRTHEKAEEALHLCFMEEVAEVPSVKTCLSLWQSGHLHTSLLEPGK